MARSARLFPGPGRLTPSNRTLPSLIALKTSGPLAEDRLALTIPRPRFFVKGAFSTPGGRQVPFGMR